jgi:hypothetical protein
MVSALLRLSLSTIVCNIDSTSSTRRSLPEVDYFKKEDFHMVPPFHKLEIVIEPPDSETITVYDKAHFATYLSLLYASGEGKNDQEMARDILRIDPEKEPHRAHQTLESHLRRARWLVKIGYQSLLEG